MLERLAEQVGKVLLQSGNIIVTAESCTGGWVAKLITDVAGSSAWFDRGFVTYTNEAKQQMLGVRAQTLDEFGAVSEQTVIEMAEGAVQNSSATIAVSISGIAGPGGGSAEKPVGMVCFGWKIRGEPAVATSRHFSGDREAVRRQAVVFCLQQLLQKVSG